MTTATSTKPHVWTSSEVDYLTKHYMGRASNVAKLATVLGVTPVAVRAQASKLHLTKERRHRWTDAEDEQLVDLVASKSVAGAAKILHMTPKSLYSRLHVLRASAMTRDGWFSGVDVCLILGVEKRWIYHRIATGKLEAVRQYNETSGCWRITKAAVLKFIKRYPTELEARKIDMVSFVDLLVGVTLPGAR